VTHAFLSEKWIESLEALRAEAPTPPAGTAHVVVNLVVLGGPEGDVQAHTSGGQLERGLGEGAPTTVKVPYEVAKKLFIEADASAAIKAVMSGELTIEGDAANLLSMQAQLTAPTPEMIAFHKKVRAFTS
jgi:hypothetical protein